MGLIKWPDKNSFNQTSFHPYILFSITTRKKHHPMAAVLKKISQGNTIEQHDEVHLKVTKYCFLYEAMR